MNPAPLHRTNRSAHAIRLVAEYGSASRHHKASSLRVLNVCRRDRNSVYEPLGHVHAGVDLVPIPLRAALASKARLGVGSYLGHRLVAQLLLTLGDEPVPLLPQIDLAD